MGKKDRNGKYGVKNYSQPESQSTQFSKKKRSSTSIKIVIAIALIAVVAVAIGYSMMPQLQPQTNSLPTNNAAQTPQTYPRNVAPTFYTTPVVSAEGAKVTVPASFVNSSKLVSVDVKLQAPMNTMEYQGRTIPLAYYKNGEYLPLILISTPSGKTVAGIRTCEPCGSFSFHIVPGEILQCDACGTEWKVEDFAPVSGGCLTYPPPKLTATVGDNVEIDLSTLQIDLAA